MIIFKKSVCDEFKKSASEMAYATMVILKNGNATGLKNTGIAYLNNMFENSVHFLPTFRTPYTPFENISEPVPFTHKRIQNFSVLRTSFLKISP